MQTAYRTLVIATMLLCVVFYFLPHLDYLWLNEDELTFLLNNGAKPIIVIPNIIWNLLFALWLCTYAGLFFLNNIARSVFSILLAINIVIIPLSGYLAYSPFEATLSYILNLADGAILIIIYFTSVASSFTNQPNKALQPTPKNGSAEL